MASPPDKSTLAYSKVCELEDFSDPALVDLIREVCLVERTLFGEGFPAGHEFRKNWEVTMTIRALRDHGCLRPDAEILGVGAGHEATVYWLTNHVRRVFATDLYLSADSWSEYDSAAEMLVDPGRYWPGAWNPRRLVVQHMNGLDLQYEDETFDAVFSSSSIEHFGEPVDVRRALAEMHRVLKPGGLAAVSTEFRLEGPPPGMPGVLLFDAEDLQRLALDGLDWELVGSLDTAVSRPTLDSAGLFGDAVADILAKRRTWSHYPHIVLRHQGHLFTSVHLALRKREGV